MTVHEFSKSLGLSHTYADAPWWEEVYRRAFPSLRSMTDIRQDGWAQRGGIDRLLTLSDGTTLKIDEKVRSQDWPDFLLERWSDRERKEAGWTQKALTCDFIAYAFIPSATCYLLPFQTLRRAWRDKGHDWITLAELPMNNGYRIVLAENGGRNGGRGWTTENVAVPRNVLLAALSDAMHVTWTPAVEDAA
jgi:hypothetical protein